MTNEPKKENSFFLNNLYPDASNLFKISIDQLSEETVKKSIFVLDTNVLLLPYSVSSSSFKEIQEGLNRLRNDSSLKIPGQVAREFIKNRPEKIKEIHTTLHDKHSFNLKKLHNYPLLQDLDSYKKIKEIEKELQKLHKTYAAEIAELMQTIENWQWDDPVSKAYKELFDKSVIIDLIVEEKTIETERAIRYANKRPPGYKDQGKSDGGIGDFLIWKTILQIGKESKKNVIFVSSDKKTDWYYQSGGKPLYPRFELIEEFQRETNGQAIHFTDATGFLELLKTNKTTVDEVSAAENSLDVPNLSSWIWSLLARQEESLSGSPYSHEEVVLNWFEKKFPSAKIYPHFNKDLIFIEWGARIAVHWHEMTKSQTSVTDLISWLREEIKAEGCDSGILVLIHTHPPKQKINKTAYGNILAISGTIFNGEFSEFSEDSGDFLSIE